MLTQVADGVWVRQSEWVWTNSIVVRGEDGLILVQVIRELVQRRASLSS